MELEGFKIYPRSMVEITGTTYFLARQIGKPANRQMLGLVGDIVGFEGEQQGDVLLCPLTPANASALRTRLPWLNPAPLGTQTSAGFGDRLGLATPGHAQAARGTNIAPIFAQQSVRENERTGRAPQQVMDDAMWGVFQEGWREPWGADADHLKTPADVDAFAAAGYTFFTIDPGDHVDNAAHSDDQSTLLKKLAALPWGSLWNSTRSGCCGRRSNTAAPWPTRRPCLPTSARRWASGPLRQTRGRPSIWKSRWMKPRRPPRCTNISTSPAS